MIIFHLFLKKHCSMKLNELACIKKLKANDLLVDFDDPIMGIPLLLEGAIKIVREDKKGEEMVLYFLESGDTCASSLSTAFSNKKCAIRATAETDSEIIFIPKREIG